jgi:glycosyltransferase involved in cell wall biosynthesis
MNPAVSVIMPAYNEGRCIFENIRTTRAVLADTGIEAEIVAVDDGSTDDTRAEIERAARELPGVVAARNPYNMGKGMALRTGFDRSSGEIVVFLDADLDLHPSQIRRLLEVLGEGPYDIVTTSKHHPDSKLDYPFRRTVASWCYYLFIKALFALPVRDTQTGLKVFRRKVLEDVFHRLLVKKFAYDVELLAASVRFGYRVKEYPVVLDFKRELKWGRIRFTDVLSLFVDTLAIFYRLRILRYYDAVRPPLQKERKRVLVVVRDCPPPPDVIARLEFDGAARIACLAGPPAMGNPDDGVLFFPGEDALGTWFDNEGDRFEYVGFLDAGCLPLGSWVWNAVRNFGDPLVSAVCGPVIPGPAAGWREEAAGMVASSSLTAGTDVYLYSFRTVRVVRKGFAGNLFLRASLLGKERMRESGLDVRHGFVFDRSPRGGRMRYDPDVAVSKRVPPLFIPYLREVRRKAFDEGRRAFDRGNPERPLRGAAPLALVLLAAGGWMVLPEAAYSTFLALYGAAVALSAFSYFSLRLAFPVAAGIILEHIVRAAAFPAGMLVRLLKIKPQMNTDRHR